MSIKKCVAITCDNCKAEITFYETFINTAIRAFKKCGGIERGKFHYCSVKCKNNHRGIK